MRAKKDLRIIKTQKELFNALERLMKNKSFEDIKVSDICVEALINRSTFYDHYEDKYELLVDFINSKKEQFTEELKTNTNHLNTKAYYMEMIKLLLIHIEDQKELYYSILKHNRNSIVMDILIDVVTKDVENRIENDIKNSIPSEIITKFYIGAVANIGMEYLKNNNKYTKEEMFKYINSLIPDNIELL
jgi:AcrR family transcriptional regulator